LRIEGIPVPNSDRFRFRAASPVIRAFDFPQLIARADTTNPVFAIDLISACLDSKQRFQAAMAMLSNTNVL
jgi:hypothetical protein